MLAEVLVRWVKGMHQGFKRFHPSPPPDSAQSATLIEQLCTYSQQAITATQSCGQKSPAPVPDKQLQTYLQTPVTMPASQQQGLATGQAAESPLPTSLPAAVEGLTAPVMDLLVLLVTAASNKLKVAVLRRPVKLACALVEAVQQQHGAFADEHVRILVDPKSAVGRLR